MKRTKRRDPRPLHEHKLQQAVVEMLPLVLRRDVAWYHIPNGELRPPGVGEKLKKMGVIAGAPDLAFVLPPEGRAAFIELKTDTGRPTVDQLAFAAQARAAGAPYAVCRSWDEVNAALRSWGALRAPPVADVRRVAA